MIKITLLVIKEEEKVGQRYGQLDFLLIGDKVGNFRENYDFKREEYLNYYFYNSFLF